MLVIVISNFYVSAPKFEEITYLKYQEEYAYNLKNSLVERYRNLAMELPIGSIED